MLKMKRSRTSGLLMVVGLVILSVVIAACGADSAVTEAPVGLRSTAIDDLVQDDSAGADEAVEPAAAETADAALEQVPEADIGSASAELNGIGRQARVADRSAHVFDPQATTEPGPAEIEGLLYMREEEKLARDVYLALYAQWGQPIFQNIANSEQTHMDSVLMLLEQYGLTDPAAGLDVGQFNDPLFQSLYEQLVDQGSLSQAEALKVGATIEELDIVDLEERLAQTENAYIIQVYTNLLAGSENHLRAFVSNLERQTGELYLPAHLDQDDYQAIISGASERGVGNGGYRGGNGSGGNGNGNGRRNGQNGNA